MMYRLFMARCCAGPAALLLLVTLTLSGCGGIDIPFIGDDDETDLGTATDSAAIPKEDMVVQQFGPASGSDNAGARMDDAVLAGPQTMSVAPAVPAAPAQPVVVPPSAVQTPAVTTQPVQRQAAAAAPPPQPVTRPAAPPAAETRTASNTQAPAAASQIPKEPGCNAFEKICAQVVKDFVFRYRAGEVEKGVYGVVGYVAPKTDELKGKKLDMTIVFAVVKDEG
jgi:hypothetical protein